MLAMGLALLPASAQGVTHLKRMDEAPPITLKEMGGGEFSTARARGKILVLVFGELGHEKTQQAYDQIDAAMHDPRLSGVEIAPILIVTHEVKSEELSAYPGKKRPSTILHDADRTVFGTYRVAVMPSVVVVDGQGRVVHALAGLTGRFADTMTDALLLASGKLTVEKFEQSLNPAPTTGPGTDVRAERIAQLARQLARRGMDELALEKYVEALALDDHNLAARLELGMLLLKARRLPEAERELRGVLAADANNAAAALGLAFVQQERGGDELKEAERTVRVILAKNPTLPRAHYLMGLIQEKRGNMDDALASFKKAAQLLLERSEEIGQ
jgi:thioredoxin-like negative regulator of GroEL